MHSTGSHGQVGEEYQRGVLGYRHHPSLDDPAPILVAHSTGARRDPRGWALRVPSFPAGLQMDDGTDAAPRSRLRGRLPDLALAHPEARPTTQWAPRARRASTANRIGTAA